jgi:UDP-N-acetylmuramoylalanine-D-glutamate ligase
MEQIYKGKKVVIMGLGLHGGGVAAAKFFATKDQAFW